MKRATRPSKEDYRYYFTHNISITTSGNFNTRGLKFCIEEIGIDRCLYSIGKTSKHSLCQRRNKSADYCLDTPYDTIKEAQDWWKSVDLPEREKEAVARENAIRLFKLPLSL
jgi:2,3-dihydroxybenzoate decarboxylase